MNMLKTLYGSFHSDKAIAELDKLGVSVYKIGEDGSKQFRKAQDVMLDLAVATQGTNQSLEETYKQLAGGKLQWSKAGATLGDYKEFIRTWGEAVNSIGFTDKQVGMQLDTISRRLQTLKTDMLSLSVAGGNAGITGVLKDTISGVDNFVTGLKEIPAWSVEAAGGLAIAAKGFIVLKNAITATNIASLASRATPLGATLTALAAVTIIATEAIGSHANAQREANRQATDAIAVAQQQQQQLEKQSEFTDALMGAHQKLQEQISGSAEGTEKYNKAVENQQETEKQLTRILGEDAVERIKDANWSIDAYNTEKQAFEDGVAAKKKALQQMVDARITELESERDVIATSIENYWKDADNFKNSIELKAKYLGWWKAIQMEYSEWKIGNAESGVSDLQKQINEIDQQMSEGGSTDILSRRREILQGQLEQEQASLKSQQEAYQKDIAGETADLQDKKSELDKQLIDLKGQSLKLSEVPSGLKIAENKPPKNQGPKNAPQDKSDEIQKKLDNYNVKSIEDQAAIAQNNYKARLDSITAATDRYGKSYAFLNDTTDTMNKRVTELQTTTAALNDQLTSDLQKVNEFASSTGATISMSGPSASTETEQIINDMAAKYGVDPKLAQAIAQVESGKNQEAVSSAGAIGVMQLMPDTAKGLGVNPYDLSGNIEGGVSYIAQLLQDFNGDIEKAVAGYNAGGGAVKKYGGIPPYAETQDYVRKVMEEYNSQPDMSTQQISVSIPQEVLDSAGVSTDAWAKMSAESKKQFISANKEQIKDSQLLIGYLEQVAGEQKKIAEYQKQITEERKKEYETLIKGIQDIESYQVKRAELSSRTSLASLGYYATDSDKAVNAQQLTQQKLAASNAALAYAKSKGVDVFTDPTMSEERVKNLELQQQVQQMNTFATPEARYKQRMSEVEYNQKMSQYGVQGNTTSPYNAQLISTTNLEAAQEKVKALKQLLDDMTKASSFASQTEEFKKYNLELQEATKNAKELADTYSTKMKQGVYDVTNELLLQGKKIQDIWGNLWKQLANDALKALMGVKNDSPGILAQAIGGLQGSKKSSNTTLVSTGIDLLGTAVGKLGNLDKSKSSSGFDFTSKNLLDVLANNNKSTTPVTQQKSSGTNWSGILGSLSGLFHANGGVVDSPSIAGEDGKEVIIPVEKNLGNSRNLLNYAAGKLGVTSGELTANFSNKNIAQQATSVAQQSTLSMKETNGLLGAQNKILFTMLGNMGNTQGQQQSPQAVILNNQQTDDSLYSQIQRMTAHGYDFSSK